MLRKMTSSQRLNAGHANPLPNTLPATLPLSTTTPQNQGGRQLEELPPAPQPTSKSKQTFMDGVVGSVNALSRTGPRGIMDVNGEMFNTAGIINSIKEHPIAASILNRLPSVDAETLAPVAKKVYDSLPEINQLQGDRLPAIKAAAQNARQRLVATQPMTSITRVVRASSLSSYIPHGFGFQSTENGTQMQGMLDNGSPPVVGTIFQGSDHSEVRPSIVAVPSVAESAPVPVIETLPPSRVDSQPQPSPQRVVDEAPRNSPLVPQGGNSNSTPSTHDTFNGLFLVNASSNVTESFSQDTVALRHTLRPFLHRRPSNIARRQISNAFIDPFDRFIGFVATSGPLTEFFTEFEGELANFATPASPVRDPICFQAATRSHITSALKNSIDELSDNPTPPQFPFPYFFAYTLAHTRHCGGGTSLSDDLEAEVLKWDTYTLIESLSKHAFISNTLWDFLDLCRPCHSNYCGSRARVQTMLRLDATFIIAQLCSIRNNLDLKEALFSQDRSSTKYLLNLLQSLLDIDDLDRNLHPPVVRTIAKISREFGMYPDSFHLSKVKLLDKNMIDSGGFAYIYKGLLGPLGRRQTVAIKVMRITQQSQFHIIHKHFALEAVTWRRLSHPNVLPFYGVYLWNERLCLISPWMENGNVVSYLSKVESSDRGALILDVAHGLEYLHSLQVIHGDLKGDNILVTPSLRACIADFGLCSTVRDSKAQFPSTSVPAIGGTLHFQAPEILAAEVDDVVSNRNTCASDIYSFGCVCYQIFTGHVPLYDISNQFALRTMVMEGHRPERPSSSECKTYGLNDEIWALMERCWKQQPNERPTAKEVVDILSSMPSIESRPPSTASGWDVKFMSQLRSTFAKHP